MDGAVRGGGRGPLTIGIFRRLPVDGAGMIDPIVLTLCPDGTQNGRRVRVIWPASRVVRVREVPAHPDVPEMARCEVLECEADIVEAGRWCYVAETFEEVSKLLGARS